MSIGILEDPVATVFMVESLIMFCPKEEGITLI